MDHHRSLAAASLTALLYFAGAALSVHFSRFGGGVAMIWVPSAVLVARMQVIRTGDWPANLVLCGIASALATGLFGFGWPESVPLALVNMAEALLAGGILRYLLNHHWPRETLELVGGLYLGLALFVPSLSALGGGMVAMLIAGQPFETNYLHWLIGHAVGFVTLLPPMLCAVRFQRAGRCVVPRGALITTALVAGTMGVLAMSVFAQPSLPLVVLPVAFALYAAVFGSSLLAFSQPVILALVGGVLTQTGKGPLIFAAVEPGDSIQLFELYVAFTALCIVPIVVEQERRRGDWFSLTGSTAGRDERNLRRGGGQGQARTSDCYGLILAASAAEAGGTLVALSLDGIRAMRVRRGSETAGRMIDEFVALVRRALRETDTLAVLGEARFALFLPGVSPVQAQRICDRIGARLAELDGEGPAHFARLRLVAGYALVGEDPAMALAQAERTLDQTLAAGMWHEDDRFAPLPGEPARIAGVGAGAIASAVKAS